MNDIFKRLAAIYKLFCVIALCVIVRIVYLQYISPTEIKAEDISYREEITEASRGDILARDGKPLAISVPYYEVRMDCVVANKDTFNKYIDALSRDLAKFYKNKSAATYKRELTNARKNGRRYQAIGNRLLDYSELEQVKKFPILKLGANRGGLIVIRKYKRNNPYGRLAYRTIGFINTEGVGVGIEGSCDYYLKGEPGKQILQKMLGGEWRPLNSDQTVLPVDGKDIKTTIDIGIQEVAEKALREQLAKGNNVEGATALVMEVKSGAIRAIVNMKKGKNGGYDESYNYAIGDATEPGSVFKLVTLISLLEDRYVTLSTPIDAEDGRWNYGGHTYTDTRAGGYGLLDVKSAFAKSSNVAFAKMAAKHYGANERQYTNNIQSMKIGERYNLDIQGEARSTIYTPDDVNMWSKTSLTSMSIGYATLITPLHTLTFYNAVANNGKMMKPYFIDSYSLNGEVVQKFPPQVLSGAICSESTVKAAQEALRYVVTYGTGKSLNNKNYQIAGKTGTARMSYGGKYGYEKNGYRRYQASFSGYFPADNPQYTALVILYSGDTRGNFYGGSQAGPVFRQIADYIYSTSPDWQRPLSGKKSSDLKAEERLPNISSGRKSASLAVLSELDLVGNVVNAREREKGGWVSYSKDSVKIVSSNFSTSLDSLMDVRNMGLKDAIYVLENSGYKVKYSGYGKIVGQTPKAGSKVSKGTVINLQLEEDYDE